MTEIAHPATVIAVETTKITLQLTSENHCHNCALQNVCSSGEASERTITLNDKKAAKNFYIGQNVEVILSSKQITQAAVYGYILPLLLVLFFLFVPYFLTHNETLAALLSLAVIPVYYSLLWLFRKKIKKTLQISIRQTKKTL